MNLLLFDVDSVLTDTRADDERLLREALLETMPSDAAPPPIGAWSDFEEVTHPAIVRNVITRACNRPARDGELMIVRKKLLEKWQRAVSAHTSSVPARPAARELVDALRKRKGTVVAFISGAWNPIADLKLTAAGLLQGEVGKVTAAADDAETRAEILHTAQILAAAARGTPGFSATVLVSARVWDARCAQRAQVAFVGVADSPSELTRLRAAGASAVISALAPLETFLSAVQTAITQRQAARSN